jgi:hypothetical protein
MMEREIVELAAILVNQHGYAALDAAERRRDQHTNVRSDAYRLWARIAVGVRRLLRVNERRRRRRARPSGNVRTRDAHRRAAGGQA